MKNKAKTVQQIIEEQEHLRKRLKNARTYLEKGEHVEGSAWLHMDDWRGRSGHPKWIANWMILNIKKVIADKEKGLERIATRTNKKKLAARRHQKS